MSSQISVLSNMRVVGAVVLDKDQVTFPVSATAGTMILKGDTVYMYMEVSGLMTWYPIIRAASATYLHTQAAGNTVWTVTHNLSTSDLFWQLQDMDGNMISPASVEHVDTNTVKFNFTEAAVGVALLIGANSIDVPEIQATVINVGTTVRIDDSGIYFNNVAVAQGPFNIGNGTTQQMSVAAGERLDFVSGDGIDVTFDDATNKITIAANLTQSDIVAGLGFTPVNVAVVGAANGLAPLDAGGLIASNYLPSYVDDVIEVATHSALPGTGVSGKIYVVVADETNSGATSQYRWSGSAYVRLIQSPGSTDSVTEGSTNLYFTQGRVRATPLTGLSTSTNSAVVSTDTVLQAVGKLQAQVTAQANAGITNFAGIPYDMAGACQGKPSAGAVIAPLVIARACTIPAGMTLSVGRATTPPASSATFNVKKNGVVVGTMTFAASATSATFAAASSISLTAGDLLNVEAPAVQDANLSDVRFTIAAALA